MERLNQLEKASMGSAKVVWVFRNGNRSIQRRCSTLLKLVWGPWSWSHWRGDLAVASQHARYDDRGHRQSLICVRMCGTRAIMPSTTVTDFWWLFLTSPGWYSKLTSWSASPAYNMSPKQQRELVLKWVVAGFFRFRHLWGNRFKSYYFNIKNSKASSWTFKERNRDAKH